MLSNRLALVTGGASGIGFAIGDLYAKENATVILVDINPNVTEKVTQLKGPNNHSAFISDVSKSDQVQNLFSQIKEIYPERKVPNVIVNCAGILDVHPIVDMTEESYDRVMNVNLKGPFLITQAAARELIKNFDSSKISEYDTYASIVNISSIAGIFGMDNIFSYAASKSGLIRLTKTSAIEFGKYKIRVNAILPGGIDTPMTKPSINQENVISYEIEQTKSMLQMTPLSRYGQPQEVAETALFLASDKSSFITGAELVCSGGFRC